MIPVAAYQNPAPGTREANALKKARKERPSVELEAQGFVTQYWRVKDKYTVHIDDSSGQLFIGCNCLAGNPPEEQQREPSPCFHAAGVLLHIAEEEKENG